MNVIHIRGEHIFKDKKYDLTKHLRFKQTADYDESLLFETDKFIKKFKKERGDQVSIEETVMFGNEEILDKTNVLHFTNID